MTTLQRGGSTLHTHCLLLITPRVSTTPGVICTLTGYRAEGTEALLQPLGQPLLASQGVCSLPQTKVHAASIPNSLFLLLWYVDNCNLCLIDTIHVSQLMVSFVCAGQVLFFHATSLVNMCMC